MYIKIYFNDKKILFHDNKKFNFTIQNMKTKLFDSLNVTLLMFYYTIFQSVLYLSGLCGRDRMVV